MVKKENKNEKEKKQIKSKKINFQYVHPMEALLKNQDIKRIKKGEDQIRKGQTVRLEDLDK